MSDTKADKYAKRFARLDQTLEECISNDELLATGDIKIGADSNFVVIEDGAVRFATSDESMNIAFTPEEITMRGGSVNLDAGFSRVRFEGDKALNPLMKQKPTNVVNHYSPIITIPPGIATGLVRGITGVIMGLLEAYRAYKETQDNAGQD